MDDSPIWSDLLKIREVYLRGRIIKVADGKKTLFWKDTWLRDRPLCLLHPVLFEWSQDKDITVYDVLQSNGRVAFDRWLPPILFEEWIEIINATFSFDFKTQADEISWKWGKNQTFTTKSTYEHLTCQARAHFGHIWKSKIPYKIKIFTWLLEKNAILTKDNLLKGKWLGNPNCSFCDQPESIDHLFFQCPVVRCIWGLVGSCFKASNIPGCYSQYRPWIEKWLPEWKFIHHFGFAATSWAIWKSRNKAIFDNKIIRHPAEILIHACVFLKYWTGLQKEEVQVGLLEGVKTLLACAHQALVLQGTAAPRMLLAPPTPTAEETEED